MRFSAPKHLTSIDLSTGPVTVEDGVVTVPDDLSAGDQAGLRANGFEMIGAVAEQRSEPEATPAVPSPAAAPEPAAPEAAEGVPQAEG